MKLSIFTTLSDPICREDAATEAIHNYIDLADEVVIVNGGGCRGFRSFWDYYPGPWDEKRMKMINYKWPEKFDWPFIGQQFQRGLDACTGDFAIRMDIDYLFHEEDFDRIRNFLEEYKSHPVIAFNKKQFILVDRFAIKCDIPLAINKAKFGSRIKLNGGGDLCMPTLDGKENPPTLNSGIDVWNYDWCFKSKEVVDRDWARFDDAWRRHSGKGFGKFDDMMTGRFNGRHWTEIPIEAHPKHIQKRIMEMTPEMHGYSMWGKVKPANYFVVE